MQVSARSITVRAAKAAANERITGAVKRKAPGEEAPRRFTTGPQTIVTRTLIERLRLALQNAGSETLALKQSAYLKHVNLFYGLTYPTIEKVHKKEVVSSLGPSPSIRAIIDTASACIQDRHHEMKHCGVLTYHCYSKLLRQDITSATEAVHSISDLFDQHLVFDWATTDGLSSRGLCPLIETFPSLADVVSTWKTSENPWKRRASAVSFVKLCKPHHDFEDVILSICETALDMDHRFVQLGCGWVLREAAKKNRPRCIDFLKENAANISPEGLRYAIEKMDPETKTKLTDYHKLHRQTNRKLKRVRK